MIARIASSWIAFRQQAMNPTPAPSPTMPATKCSRYSRNGVPRMGARTSWAVGDQGSQAGAKPGAKDCHRRGHRLDQVGLDVARWLERLLERSP